MGISTAVIVICERCDRRLIGADPVQRALAQGWEVHPRGLDYCPDCRKLRERERIRDGR